MVGAFGERTVNYIDSYTDMVKWKPGVVEKIVEEKKKD